MKTIKNKCSADVEGNERRHAVAMKYEFVEMMMHWSLDIVSDEMVLNPPTERAARARTFRHGEFRAFLAVGWTLWLRYAVNQYQLCSSQH